MYGDLCVISGSMYASKSTELLRRILWARFGENKTVLVLKLAYDDRYHATKIVSHDGLSADAIAITAWEEVLHLVPDAEVVCFDEIQFFTEPHFKGDLVSIIRTMLTAGKDVVAAGLNMDSDGNPYRITADCLAMADEIIKKNAHCTICGKPASKTWKMTQNGIRNELGSSDLYQARCNAHWLGLESQTEDTTSILGNDHG